MRPTQLAEISRYRFAVPGEWELERLPSDGALHAIHAQAEEGATVQLEVVEGLGTPEVLERYLGMHRALAGTARMDAPRRAEVTGLSLEVAAGEALIHRRIEAALVAGDLLSVVLSWSKAVEDTGALQHAALRALDSALPEPKRQRA
jgi:hypothetical protein